MAKAASGIDQNVLAAYDAMVAGVPGAERKGATLPYTSINGNMYSSISKANVIGLRLSKTDLTTFLETYGATLHEGVPGFIQKEYASIPEALLGDTATLQAWFRKSHAHAQGLKPKRTTR
jgi:hypothetical protein